MKRAVLGTAFLALCAFFLFTPVVDSQITIEQQQARQIALNTARLDSVERDIMDMKTWRTQHPVKQDAYACRDHHP